MAMASRVRPSRHAGSRSLCHRLLAWTAPILSRTPLACGSSPPNEPLTARPPVRSPRLLPRTPQTGGLTPRTCRSSPPNEPLTARPPVRSPRLLPRTPQTGGLTPRTCRSSPPNEPLTARPPVRSPRLLPRTPQTGGLTPRTCRSSPPNEPLTARPPVRSPRLLPRTPQTGGPTPQTYGLSPYEPNQTAQTLSRRFYRPPQLMSVFVCDLRCCSWARSAAALYPTYAPRSDDWAQNFDCQLGNLRECSGLGIFRHRGGNRVPGDLCPLAGRLAGSLDGWPVGFALPR